jgi:hypothetical protein
MTKLQLSKFFGGLGLIFVIFGAPSAFLFTGIFATIAMIQVALGIAGIAYFCFYSVGDAIKAIGRKKDSILGVVGGLLILALLIGLNVVAQSQFGERQFDTTTNRVNSLAPESEALAKNLERPLRIMAFYENGHRNSEVLKNLVKKYNYFSTKIELEVLDPNENPGELQAFEAQTNEVVLARLSEDGTIEKTLKVFTGRDVPTEEALTNGLKRVLMDAEKVIYFLQGNGQSPVDGAEDPRGLYLATSRLQAEGFVTRPLILAQTNEIPKDASIVVSWGAERSVSAREIQVLENYLQRGGSLVIGLNPFISPQSPPRFLNHGFEPLLASFGLRSEAAVTIEILNVLGRPSPSTTVLGFNYSAHPIVQSLAENRITQFGLTLPIRSTEKVREGLRQTALVTTSDNSWGETNLAALLQRDQGSASKNTAQGDIAGPFPIAQIVEWKVEKPAEGDWSADGKLVVFGNASFGTDSFFNAQYNRDLFLNTFSFMSGQDATTASLEIRPRTWTQSTLQMDENQKVMVYYASLFVIPQLILILGLFVWISRRRA